MQGKEKLVRERDAGLEREREEEHTRVEKEREPRAHASAKWLGVPLILYRNKRRVREPSDTCYLALPSTTV